MTDFSTEKQIRDKLKGYKPKLIGPIGEVAVALQFLDVFKDKIESIDKRGDDVDLTIKFKDEEKPIAVEVKSSDGVPIKTKDFGYEFDLLAMVNFILPDKTNSLGKNSSKIRSDSKLQSKLSESY